MGGAHPHAEKERMGCKPNPGFVLPTGKQRHQSDCCIQELKPHDCLLLHNCYVRPLRLMLFTMCNSNYIMLYQNKSGVRLATRPLFLRVRTGAAHLNWTRTSGHSVMTQRREAGQALSTTSVSSLTAVSELRLMYTYTSPLSHD